MYTIATYITKVINITGFVALGSSFLYALVSYLKSRL